MEEKPLMYYYELMALRAMEKSLYDVLDEQQLGSTNSPLNYMISQQERPNSNQWEEDSNVDYGNNNFTSAGAGNLVDDTHGVGPSSMQNSLPGDYNFQTNLQPILPDVSQGLIGAPATVEMTQVMCSSAETVLHFKRGFEEASKFLPSADQLVVDLAKTDNSGSLPTGGKTSHVREDYDLEEERSNKQLAVQVEESDMSEIFDQALLWNGESGDAEKDGECKMMQLYRRSKRQNNRKTGAKRHDKKKITVDLTTLLIQCARAVSINNARTADELLKQIKPHASAFGNGTQRIAHYFANGLEARLAGTSTGVQNFFASLSATRITDADLLKTYITLLKSCPFKRFSIFFANEMILHAAGRAAALHIVDFGVQYGYQWPLLIQKLACRPGGPPKLRITGIDPPQRGFRPVERIEEAGRFLAKYCERFNVPFEYNPIAAKNWESIPIQDLKIRSDEVLAVNCLTRFKNLHDETDEVMNCPRDAVLGLIKKMNPNIFVHCVLNGSYNSPFFLGRFREALFHFSSVFDIFDSTLHPDDQERLMLEREILGLEIINVIACEGQERVERPETYKQWQVRTMRAGFKSLPLDQKLLKKFKGMLKANYHEDFMMDEDRNWMLQGWKGRTLYASSCWVPAA